MAKGGNDCSVCLEEFTESGCHLPRILPCSHTFCQRCIKELLKGAHQLVCPVDRKKLPAPQAEKSFPQNSFAIDNIKLRARMKKLGQTDKKEEKDLCPDHKKVQKFYCKYSACRKFVCKKCLIKSHKDHDFVDRAMGQLLVESKRLKIKEDILREIDREEFFHEKVRSRIVYAQEQVCKKLETSLAKLTREKNAIINLFEKKIEKISKEKQDVNVQAERLIADLDRKTEILRKIKETAGQSENIPDVAKALEEISTHTKAREEEGNVVLTYTESGSKDLTNMVERALSEDFAQRTEKVLLGKMGKPVGKFADLFLLLRSGKENNFNTHLQQSNACIDVRKINLLGSGKQIQLNTSTRTWYALSVKNFPQQKQL